MVRTIASLAIPIADVDAQFMELKLGLRRCRRSPHPQNKPEHV